MMAIVADIFIIIITEPNFNLIAIILWSMMIICQFIMIIVCSTLSSCQAMVQCTNLRIKATNKPKYIHSITWGRRGR